MNCSDWTEKLSDHLDGALSPADTRALEAHLAACPSCRAQLSALRDLRAATQALPREIPPSRDLWPDLESALTPPSSVGACLRAMETPPRSPSPVPSRPARLLAFPALWLKVAACLALLVAGTATWTWLSRDRAPASPGPGWSVTSLAGAPQVARRSVSAESRLRVGQWLETDATSRAKVAVGAIGEVSVEPNSRLRLVGAGATDHRLELARGRLSALIWAPPRLFFVDTPSATAVDLGCAYTLAVDDAGDAELRVTSGYVALEHGDREAVIPAGHLCRTRRGAGPGTPFAADAPAPLQAALRRFDTAPTAESVSEILLHARPADAVTLWHLLARVPSASRASVFDALAAHHAPPAGVTRAGILSGDTAMRHAWAADLGLGAFPRR